MIKSVNTNNPQMWFKINQPKESSVPGGGVTVKLSCPRDGGPGLCLYHGSGRHLYPMPPPPESLWRNPGEVNGSVVSHQCQGLASGG